MGMLRAVYSKKTFSSRVHDVVSVSTTDVLHDPI